MAESRRRKSEKWNGGQTEPNTPLSKPSPGDPRGAKLVSGANPARGPDDYIGLKSRPVGLSEEKGKNPDHVNKDERRELFIFLLSALHLGLCLWREEKSVSSGTVRFAAGTHDGQPIRADHDGTSGEIESSGHPD